MLELPPLSLYIHFPWCVQKCPYCDFNSHVLKADLPEKDYIQALCRDWDNEQKNIKHRKLISIYLGGGTPSLFSGDAIYYLLRYIRSTIAWDSHIEITLEANPDSVILNRLMHYRQAGVNRISLGIQTLNDEALKNLGRTHNRYKALKAIEIVKAAGFHNFNVDIMHGLPNQTQQLGLQDLQEILQYHPTHLSWYQLTLEPHTAFFNNPPILPHEDLIVDLQEEGAKLLTQYGLYSYEIAAFSQPHLNCIHNNNYWLSGDYIGIGAGAHSKITYPEQNRIMRYVKHFHPKAYLNAQSFIKSTQVVEANQRAFEFMLNHCRLYRPITWNLFGKRTGLHWEVLLPKLNKGVEKKLLEWDANQMQLTSLGNRFYNNVVGLFL